MDSESHWPQPERPSSEIVQRLVAREHAKNTGVVRPDRRRDDGDRLVDGWRSRSIETDVLACSHDDRSGPQFEATGRHGQDTPVLGSEVENAGDEIVTKNHVSPVRRCKNQVGPAGSDMRS